MYKFVLSVRLRLQRGAHLHSYHHCVHSLPARSTASIGAYSNTYRTPVRMSHALSLLGRMDIPLRAYCTVNCTIDRHPNAPCAGAFCWARARGTSRRSGRRPRILHVP